MRSDNELNSKIQLINQKQRRLIYKVQTWAQNHDQSKLRAILLENESLHIFLTGHAGCGKSFLMRFIYHSLTKTLSYGSALVDKPKTLLMAPTGVVTINIDGTV